LAKILAKAGALYVRRPLSIADNQAMASYFGKLIYDKLNLKGGQNEKKPNNNSVGGFCGFHLGFFYRRGFGAGQG
jgi:hypothetical protein